MTDESEQSRLDELADTGGSTDGTDSGVARTADPVQGEEADPAGTTQAGDATETVEVGVALLAHLEAAELSLADAVDRVVTGTPAPAPNRD